MKKSTKICMLATVCAALLVLACAPLAAFAKTESVLIDDLNIAKSIILQTAEAEEIAMDNADYIVKDVYYSNEQWAGYVIDFTANDLNGYAIFFKMEGNLTLVEVSFQRSSAYINREGQFIYPSLGYYYTKINGRYYDAETMEEVDFKPTAEPTFYAACSNGGKSELISKEMKYNKLLTQYNELNDFYYDYCSNGTGNSNCCSNVAGVVALNYWNKKFNNDLLNLPLSSLKNDNILYKYGDSNCPAVQYMRIFYNYMNTNWFFGTGGTLPNNCYKGFEKLIAEKGYKTTRTACKQYTEMRNCIDNGIPIFITSKDYYFTTGKYTRTLPEENTVSGNYSDTIHYTRYYGVGSEHTFIGYGYQYINFYYAGNVQISLFIKVADGWGDTCYFNYDLSNVMDAVGIKVYK